MSGHDWYSRDYGWASVKDEQPVVTKEMLDKCIAKAKEGGRNPDAGWVVSLPFYNWWKERYG